jgi:hypothetical protein
MGMGFDNFRLSIGRRVDYLLTRDTSMLGLLARNMWRISAPILPSVRAHVKSVRKQLKTLENAKNDAALKPAVMVFDLTANTLGYGDFIVCLMLVKYLKDLGLSAELSIQGSWPPNGERKNARKQFLEIAASQGVDVLPSHSSINVNERILLFGEDVEKGNRISRKAFTLTSLIYDSKTLNPFGIPPILDREIQSNRSHNFDRVIGFAVRNSEFGKWRNPPSTLVLRDLKNLLSISANSKVIWFGDEKQFSCMSIHFPREIAEGRLDFQKSKDFVGAFRESLTCDFWFQRWGGGINLGPIFSATPYLMYSNDVGASSMFDRRRNSISSWSNRRQLYVLSTIRPNANSKKKLEALLS